MTSSFCSARQPESRQACDDAILSTRKLSICIVSHNAYGAIRGGNSGFIGGVEHQTSLLARWLAERGHKVTLLTWDEGGPSEEVVQGVRVLKICRANAGLPGMRFFHPRWTGLVAALREANAEVCYHNCGENVTGQIALWCHWQGKAFVFSSANETDCDAALPELPFWRDRWLYRYGLRRADRVIVQTETQRIMMKRNFGVDANVIPMPCPRPQRISQVRPKPMSNRVLWVGRVCSQKRPDRLTEMAKLMPDLQFDLVGPHFDDAIARNALARAAGLANVRVHGPVSREKMGELYENAASLLCTSDYEGFPNTFLEAWSYALPIVSTFDPDGLIVGRRMGLVATAVDGLVHSIRELLGSTSLYATASANALSYFLDQHVADKVMPEFESALVEAAENVRREA